LCVGFRVKVVGIGTDPSQKLGTREDWLFKTLNVMCMVPVYHCETLSQSTSTPTYSSISVVLFKRALSANLLRDESFYFFLLAF
jgi:hypothetical protein